ncbi:MAG: hypothetical protein ABEJ93_00525 [Candidatus Nanohalobium sp.]
MSKVDDLKKLSKEWRIWVLAAALLLSTILIGPHYERTDGEVSLATNLDDRKSIEFSGGSRILLGMKTNQTGEELRDTAQQVERILKLRLSEAGLADTSVRSLRLGGGSYKIQAQTGSSNTTRLKNLISKQGSFEARMPFYVEKGSEKEFSVDKKYLFSYNGENVTVKGEEGEILGSISKGSSISLNNNSFYFVNATNQRARMEVTAYSGQEILDVLTSQGGIRGGGSSYTWIFQIVIDKKAAERVKKVANNYQTVINRDGPQLGLENGENAQIKYYVDGEQTTSLNVGAEFKRQEITQPSIQGGAPSRAKAVQEKSRLQAILQSGQLPVPVQVESVNQISSSLGNEFLYASGLSILATLIAVGLVVFARYRDPHFVIPIVLTGASEVYILLGFWFTTVGTLSLSAIAGIIAAVGTGVDDQIIITDESGREKVSSWSDRMKRAFFVIFTSAASTIGAMMPIIQPGLISLTIGAAGAGLIGYTIYSRGTDTHYLGIGVLALMAGIFTTSLNPSGAALQSVHEFAFTTIWGIMIGILITRPAYAKTIEYIKS